MGSNPDSATCQLCECGQVTSLLCASVTSSVKWGLTVSLTRDNLITPYLPQRLEQCSAHSKRLTNTNIINPHSATCQLGDFGPVTSLGLGDLTCKMWIKTGSPTWRSARAIRQRIEAFLNEDVKREWKRGGGEERRKRRESGVQMAALPAPVPTSPGDNEWGGRGSRNPGGGGGGPGAAWAPASVAAGRPRPRGSRRGRRRGLWRGGPSPTKNVGG
uniref:Uncharacterized protein n=1 Tax=Ornithorhynchus anatinus TaxID=9258 RepID=A0A6I8N1B6_ORNAN